MQAERYAKALWWERVWKEYPVWLEKGGCRVRHLGEK